MKDVNHVTLVGRLGRDPIRRETKTGKSVTHFSLATSYRSRREAPEGASEMRDYTQWHNVVVWGKQADYCADHLRRGQVVYVDGYIRSHKYTTDDGVEKTSFEVVADNVNAFGGGPLTLIQEEPSQSMNA